MAEATTVQCIHHKKRVITTPAVSEGCVAGVIRRYLVARIATRRICKC